MRGRASGWIFVLPALALMLLVSGVPIVQTAALASDFGRMARDPRLAAVLLNTGIFTAASVLIEFAVGMALALLLMTPFRGRGLVRAAVLLPWALPASVMAMAWRWILNADYGVLGDIVHRLSLSAAPQIPWLASPGLAFISCVMADVWKTSPFMALVLMGGLAQIPAELYEAAALDGAGALRRFSVVTWPLLKPTAALALLFRAVQAFGIFDLIWVMTGGGPGGRTQTIALYVYDTVFRHQELGYGCALTLLMGLCLGALAGVIYLPLRDKAA